MPKLRLEGISKEFSGRAVLNDINLETESDEFVVILGPSGSGKSTLLRIIAGLEKPTVGKIFLDDIDVTLLEPKERNLSMVFQNYSVYPHMTVYENISLPLKILGRDKWEIKEKTYKVAEQLNITHLLERSSSNLSGGEMQRVAIGKNLIRNSDVFLLDEPLNSLDANIKLSIKDLIKRIHRDSKKLFLYVTHDFKEAMALADRIIVLNAGKIIQYSKPQEIYDNPINLFVAKFIGDPKINILEGEIFKDESGIFFKTFLGEIRLKDNTFMAVPNPVSIGIRPEKIEIERTPSSEFSLPVTVKEVEYMGSCYNMTIENSFKIVTPEYILPGDMVYLKINTDSIILFNN